MRKADAAEDVDVTVNDYEVFGFTHSGPGFVPQCFRLPLCFDNDDNVLPHTDTLEDKPISFFAHSCR